MAINNSGARIPYSPLHVVSFIRDLLRKMYFEYGGEKYAWSDDPRKSKVAIGTVSDKNDGSKIQQLPRILIQRGPSSMGSQYIADNLESHIDGGVPSGGVEIFRQDINGSINIIIEAVNEGTCEEVCEFSRKFLCWSKPFIETMFGFQAFGKQIMIGPCEMDMEDAEKFKININIPYIVEDRWIKSADLVRLDHIFREMTDIPAAVNQNK